MTIMPRLSNRPARVKRLNERVAWCDWAREPMAVHGAAAFAESIDELRGSLKRMSLVVYGDVFGGRIDNIHTAVMATAAPDGPLVVQFVQAETR